MIEEVQSLDYKQVQLPVNLEQCHAKASVKFKHKAVNSLLVN